MNKLFLFLLFMFCNIILHSQDKFPLLSGNVEVSIKNGTIECDVQLTDLELTQDYFIRLNTGLNLLNMEVKNPDAFIVGYNRDFTDSIQSDETVSYYIPSNNKGEKFCPNNIRFRYVGKFPVIRDTITNNMQREDWRGNIAFSFDNLRVDGSQSAWFPTIYYAKSDFQFDKIRYNLTIRCLDCTTLYVNGNNPVQLNEHTFISETPREPFLFLGNYKIQKCETAYFLNSNFSNEELNEIDENNKNIYSYLENYTKIPLEEKVVWIDGGYTSNTAAFGFLSFPAITVVGPYPRDLHTWFKKGNTFGVSTIVHELSHFYFGNIKLSNSYLESLIDEGFAQFLAFKYVNQKEDENYIKNEINQAIEWFEEPEFKFKAILDFNKAEDTNDRETYAYDYQTAILFSIEKEIGTERMQKWIQLLLQGEEPISDKTFLKNTLKKAINNNKKFNEIIEKYLTGNSTVANMKTLWR